MPIYLDNNSSTPIDPRVLESVMDILVNYPGNASSTHAYGQKLRQKLVGARDTIAQCLHVSSKELTFTSGATEAINLAIRGCFGETPRGHLITSDLEHEAVYRTVKYMESRGCSATYLPGGAYGAVTPDAVYEAIRPDTKLIALIGANNETGVKTDLEAIAQIALEAEIPFFVDGVALFGKEVLHIPEGVSAMSFSGHKIHAPQGVGLLFARKKMKVAPLIQGGAHEFERRAGTENLSGIVGLAKAFELIDTELPRSIQQMAWLRDRLERALLENLEGVTVNGAGPRVCNTSNLSFRGIDGEAFLAKLDLAGIAVSLGSACASGALEPSRILLNMGVAPELARASLRFSLSRMTTDEEIEEAISLICKCAGDSTQRGAR